MSRLKPTWKLLFGSNLATALILIIVTASVVSASFTAYNLRLNAFPHTSSYTIEADGVGNYRAIKYDGSTTESTSFYTLFSNTLTAMGNPSAGHIHISKGAFSLDNEFVISGIGGSDVPTNQIVIEGDGQDTVITQTATGKRIFVFQDGVSFKLLNMRLQMRSENDANSQSAIHLNAQGSSYPSYNRSVYGGIIDNVWVGGGDNTHPLVLLENFFHLTVGWWWVYSDYGTAIKIYNNFNSTNYGNSYFANTRAHGAGTGASLEITGLKSSSSIMNLLDFGYADLGYGGASGLYVHGRAKMINFDFVNVEGLSSGGTDFKINGDGLGTYDISFGKITGGIPTNGYFLDLNGSSNIRVQSGAAWDEGTPNTILRDINNAYLLGANEINLDVPSLTDASRYTITSSTKPHLTLSHYDENQDSNAVWTPHYGSSTLSNGSAITHRVGMVPTSYWATGTESGEFISIISVNATHMIVAIIKHDGTAGTSQTVNWFAAWYP